MSTAAPPLPSHTPLAWGRRVSPAFRTEVCSIARDIGVSADDLMTCMAWESGRTFSPSVTNLAGSGAIGLIQFMPAVAVRLGTSAQALARMTAEEQLIYVRAYFAPYRGRLHGLDDLYMAILWPAAIGKLGGFVLFDRAKTPVGFRQNAGLDTNHDGQVTKAECAARLFSMRAEGLRPENVA